jgi:hypothetical protein
MHSLRNLLTLGVVYDSTSNIYSCCGKECLWVGIRWNLCIAGVADSGTPNCVRKCLHTYTLELHGVSDAVSLQL